MSGMTTSEITRSGTSDETENSASSALLNARTSYSVVRILSDRASKTGSSSTSTMRFGTQLRAAAGSVGKGKKPALFTGRFLLSGRHCRTCRCWLFLIFFFKIFFVELVAVFVAQLVLLRVVFSQFDHQVYRVQAR